MINTNIVQPSPAEDSIEIDLDSLGSVSKRWHVDSEEELEDDADLTDS